ncbi:MAG TPA: hypothetical protein VII52_07310 [Gemmatimonadaceae bacterium]
MLFTPSLLAALAWGQQCTPASGDAPAVLRRAAQVIGLSRAAPKVLHVSATDVVRHDYESDRMYPPFLLQTSRIEEWFDPSTGADRIATLESMIGANQFKGPPTLGVRTASYAVRDTGLVPSAALHGQLLTTRPLNVWATVGDWIAAGDARVVGRCEYRDYPRLVLARPGTNGDERLYVDPKTGYPVAFMRTERHYLWGQIAVEYVYSTWTTVGDAHLPGVAFRLVDGTPAIARTFGDMSLAPRDSAPPLALPRAITPMQPAVAGFLAPVAPDTIRVSPSTVLLRNPDYTEVLTLARDTVFVFDATQGDMRARQDSAWIGKLFPGHHAIAVVVTDLAWPHVSGVRYWVAQGATIISHRASRAFLDKVVARRWTAAPDLLEERRSTGRRVAMHFVPVADSLRLAGGAIMLFALDGISSEGALAAFVQGDRFLWASDYIQTLAQPTQYLDEVAAAVSRMHIDPRRVAAEHLPLSDWATATALVHAP